MIFSSFLSTFRGQGGKERKGKEGKEGKGRKGREGKGGKESKKRRGRAGDGRGYIVLLSERAVERAFISFVNEEEKASRRVAWESEKKAKGER